MLEKYNKKRDFSKTNEPKGVKKTSKGKRFVVQFHEASHDHFDFRLENRGVLVSFAIPKGFSFNKKEKRLAVRVEDHPVEYINFEGVIPEGQYGAGRVQIFDKGEYEVRPNLTKGLKDGHFKVYLKGNKLKGKWAFVHFKEDNWLVIFESGRENNKEVKLPFKETEVMLAILAKKIPKGKEWWFEIKYDGYRIVSYVENGKVKLRTRNQKDYTKKFKKIAENLENLTNCAVFDGEIVVFDKNGRSDFSLLQESVKKNKSNYRYVIFDILAYDGEDLREKAFFERRKVLEKLSSLFLENLILSEVVKKDGEECFNVAKNLHLEGIMAKNKNSKYENGRSENWLKIKCYLRQEFVIGGYEISEKDGKLSALLLGYYKNGKLIYVGKVGTGFTSENKEKILKKKKKIEKKTSFFDNFNEKAHFVEPKLIAETQFSELTSSNLLRQASFLGLREDKNASEIILEEEWKKV